MPMFRDNVRTVEGAFAYLTDCTLATVSSMAMKKSPGKAEFARQKEMGQIAVNWARDFDIDVTGTRAEKILKEGLTVEQWANRQRP